MTSKTHRRCWVHVLSALLACVQLNCPAPVLAAPAAAPTNASASSSSRSVDLNLASTTPGVTAGQLRNFQTATIVVNGQKQTVTLTTMLTPAQAVAVSQILRTGVQSLVLGASGNAVGGQITITPRFAQHISSLTVPQGVSVLDRAAALNLSGNLTNAGSLYAVSGVGATSINATNILNQRGGLISTILPAGLAALYGTGMNTSLSLSALNNIINSGTISSSGNLNLTAGGAITNTSQATMQAANNVNLTSCVGSFVNNGLISAQYGNINFNTGQIASNLAVNNLQGTIKALNGSINVRAASYAGDASISLVGGDYLSRELNLYAGTGSVTAAFGRVSGKLNTVAGEEHVTADTPRLTLGNNCVSGDPLYANTGSIEIDGAITTGGANLAVIAGQDITSGSGAANAASISTNGGQVWLIAGADITEASGTTASPLINGAASVSSVTIQFDTTTGGNIDFTPSTVATVISTSGGKVTLLANSNGTGTGTGNIWFPTGTTSVDTTNRGGDGGAVLIVAGGTGGTSLAGSAIAAAIQTGQIQSAGATTTATGNVQIITGAPAITNGGGVANFTNPANSATTSATFAAANITPGAQIAAGNILTQGYGGIVVFALPLNMTSTPYPGGSGGSIFLQSGGNLTAKNLLSYGGGGAGGCTSGYADTGAVGGNAGAIAVTSYSGSVSINGEINASGGGSGGSNNGTSVAGGSQAAITITAANGIAVSGNIFSFAGGAGGIAGGYGGGGGGGSFGGGGGGAIGAARGAGGGAGAAAGGGGAAATQYSGGGGGGGFGGGGAAGKSYSSYDYYGSPGGASANLTYGSSGASGGQGGLSGSAGGTGSGSGNNLLAGGGSGNSLTGGPGTTGQTAGRGCTTGGTLTLNFQGPFSAPASVVVGNTIAYPLLTSLDLTNTAVKNQITALVASGAPGISGIYSGLFIDSSVSCVSLGSLSALNVPLGSFITFSGFAASTPAIGVNITDASTSKQATIGGSISFSNSGNSVAGLAVNSTQAGPALTLSSSGALASDNKLSITTPSLQNNGLVGAGNSLSLTTTNGDLIGTGSIMSPALMLTAKGGNIGGNAGASTALSVASGSVAGVSLFANALMAGGTGGCANLADTSSEKVTLNNSAGALNASVIFILSTKGNILASTPGSTAITSPSIFLTATGSSITGNGTATSPLLVNNGGSDLRLFASGSVVNLKDLTGDNVALFNTSAALSASTSFTLNTLASIYATSPGNTAIISPVLSLSATAGNIAGDASAATALLLNNAGSGLSLFAGGDIVNLTDNTSDTVILSNTAGTSLSGSTSFALSTNGSIYASTPTSTGIVSPSISITAAAGNITGDGTATSALIVNHGGLGLSLFAGGQIVNLSDLTAENVVLSNTLSTPLISSISFTLSTNGNIAAGTASATTIRSPDISLSAGNGNIAGNTSDSLPLRVENAGLGLRLFAGGKIVNLSDSTNETVTLANSLSTALSGSTSFALSTTGTICANVPAATAIISPSIVLTAQIGSIAGDTGSSSALLVNNAGAGLSLYASASGAAAGQGHLSLSDNSSASETLTLKNTGSALTAAQWFSVTNSNGSIVTGTTANTTIISPLITLAATASGSTIGCYTCGAAPVPVSVSGAAAIPTTITASGDSGVMLSVAGDCILTVNAANTGAGNHGVNVTASSSGTSAGNITLSGSSSTGGSIGTGTGFTLTASGDIIVNPTSAVIARGSSAFITLNAGGNITQAPSGTSLFCEGIALTARTGNIGSAAVGIGTGLPAGATAGGVALTASSGKSAYVTSANPLALGYGACSAGDTFSVSANGTIQIFSGVQITAGTAISLTATGAGSSIYQTDPSGGTSGATVTTLFSPSITLTANSGIGDSTHQVTMAAATTGSTAQTVNLTATGTGDIYLLASNSVVAVPVNLTLTGASATAGPSRFDAGASGTLTVAGTLFAPGGRIDLFSSELTVNAGATLSTSSPANGGLIQLTPLAEDSDPLAVVNNGVIQASGSSSGIIGFNGGKFRAVSVSGTGSLTGGQINLGNLDPDTLQIFQPFVIVWPFTGSFTLGNISLSQKSALGIVQVSGSWPPSPEPTPIIRIRPLTLADLGLASLSYLNLVDRLPTDLTPQVEPTCIFSTRTEQDSTRHTLAQGIMGALFVFSEFNATILSQLNSTGFATVQGENNNLNLMAGNIVLAPDRDIIVKTELGSIHIARGAVAFVMKTVDGLCLYDLADTHRGDVFVESNGMTISAFPGMQILLTRHAQPAFETLNPGKQIGYRAVNEQNLGNGVSLFTAEFSLYSALSQVKPLHHLVMSSDPRARRLGNQLLQNAVIVAQLSGNKQPYRQSP